MVNSVINSNLTQLKRIHPFQTGEIKAKEVGIRSGLMMRINAAFRAKIMLCRHGVELVKRELIGPFGNLQGRYRNIRCDSALSPTHGTITTTRIFNTVWQMHNKFNLTTMATAFMVGLNFGVSYFRDHCIAGACLMFNSLEHDNAITNVHKVPVTPRQDQQFLRF